MSVKDYIRDHYGPYMCGTDRHKWKVIRAATEEENGLSRCKWCGLESAIFFSYLLRLAKEKGFDSRLYPFADIMAEEDTILKDIPFIEVGTT